MWRKGGGERCYQIIKCRNPKLHHFPYSSLTFVNVQAAGSLLKWQWAWMMEIRIRQHHILQPQPVLMCVKDLLDDFKKVSIPRLICFRAFICRSWWPELNQWVVATGSLLAGWRILAAEAPRKRLHGWTARVDEEALTKESSLPDPGLNNTQFIPLKARLFTLTLQQWQDSSHTHTHTPRVRERQRDRKNNQS